MQPTQPETQQYTKTYKYIIEHIEPRTWRWCIIEYKHISQLVGKDNLCITNVKRRSRQLESYAHVIKKSVAELALRNACILDPEAEQTLSPEEAQQFDCFILGGILGDYPPKKRTKAELTDKMNRCAVRNIGKKQMSTDNAVCVVKEIASGKPLGELQFKDDIEIELGKNESTVLPYRYLLVGGKPLISEELVKYLRRKKCF